jgi:hypothetical protein
MTHNKFQTKIDLTLEQYYRDIHEKLISFIRELERVLGKEQVHLLVSNWAEHNSVDNIEEVIAAVEKPIENFDDVKILLRKWVCDLNESDMETVEITEESSSKSICYVSECIYAKVFNDLDAPDLGYLLYCKHDFATTPKIHPNLGLKRTKTLMQKHDCCDFEYYWKEIS